jgi:uncharacterized membrane protein YeaQ/YmgE (transglycosylase-associated protein family)
VAKDFKSGDNMFIVLWIIIGFFGGFLTGKLMKGNTFGTGRDTLTGIAGALIGGFIMRGLGFSAEAGSLYAWLGAIFGAVLLTFVVRMFLGSKSTKAS